MAAPKPTSRAFPPPRWRRSASWARRWSAPSMATCSRCTSRSRPTTRTRRRCASTPPCTTRWAAFGSTTTCRRPSPDSTLAGRPTSRTTGPTASAPLPSCRAWPTGISCCRTPLGTTSPMTSGQAKFPRRPRSSPRPRRPCRTASRSCSTTLARRRWTISTVDSAASCGTSAACPAMQKD